jgi:hypothetical protein
MLIKNWFNAGGQYNPDIYVSVNASKKKGASGKQILLCSVQNINVEIPDAVAVVFKLLSRAQKY